MIYPFNIGHHQSISCLSRKMTKISCNGSIYPTTSHSQEPRGHADRRHKGLGYSNAANNKKCSPLHSLLLTFMTIRRKRVYDIQMQQITQNAGLFITFAATCTKKSCTFPMTLGRDCNREEL